MTRVALGRPYLLPPLSSGGASLLVKYLGHEQFSVFFGDITKSTLEKMRRELNKLITDGDRVLELIAENRNNVDIVVSGKYGHIEGIPRREEDDRHKSDSGIL